MGWSRHLHSADALLCYCEVITVATTYVARNIRLFGIVQGVGMRPTIWRIAHAHNVGGWVQNGVDGVLIHAVGDATQLQQFESALLPGMPVRAQITHTTSEDAAVQSDDLNMDGTLKPFTITSSNTDGSQATLVSFDIATCDTCIDELFDSNNRRYHYPFINCTDCGPRFTIIHKLPYDRHTTSMHPFEMCPECSAEYHDPATRRFDAQPDACFLCGPQIAYHQVDGEQLTVTGTSVEQRRRCSDAIIDRCVARLKEGAIVAIKGLGGFHLVVDATNDEAVLNLRKRKRRSRKAFAIMVPSLHEARHIAHINETEARELTSCRRPIVLVRKRALPPLPHAYSWPASCDADTRPVVEQEAWLQSSSSLKSTAPCSYTECPPLSPQVTGNLTEVGIMLPYTPLHHLLLRAFNGPLVMTSGNISGEPICSTNEEAFAQLSDIADDFLTHNRDIVTRYDDSVVRIIDDTVQIVRRARGYAPIPLALPKELHNLPCIMATGAEQKDTCAISDDVHLYLSQHLGDLERPGILHLFDHTQKNLAHLFRKQPTMWIHDCHPRYLSTQWAIRQANLHEQTRCCVGHHHAHIASVLGEHQYMKPVIGLAMDGTGYASEQAVNILEHRPSTAPNHVTQNVQPPTVGTSHDAAPLYPPIDAQPEHDASRKQLSHQDSTHAPAPCNDTYPLSSPHIDAASQYDKCPHDVADTTEQTQLWGGEIFLSTMHTSQRIGTLQSLVLPGGTRAIMEPWRIAYAWLYEANCLNHPGAKRFLRAINEHNAAEVSLVDTMIAKRINLVYSSSAGRLFDAVSALIGCTMSATYEGEPAIMLEALLSYLPDYPVALDQYNDPRYRLTPWTHIHTSQSNTKQQTPLTILGHHTLLHALLEDLEKDIDLPCIAARFHEGFVQSLCSEVMRASGVYSIDICACAGGVFMNKTVTSRLRSLLNKAHIQTISNRELPVNDGSIAYGQAISALAAHVHLS